MSIEIRRAAITDLDWIVEELKQFSLTYPTKLQLFEDESHVRAGMRAMIERHVVLVAVRDEVEPIGFIAGMKTPHIFNPNVNVLYQLVWWVSIKHRGSLAGLKLLKAFVESGENVDWIIFGLNQNTPISEKTMNRHGFKFKETHYILEVK